MRRILLNKENSRWVEESFLISWIFDYNEYYRLLGESRLKGESSIIIRIKYYKENLLFKGESSIMRIFDYKKNLR